MATQTTTSTINRSYIIDEKIIPKDTKSLSVSYWTESILYARSRNVVFTANGLKPLTKHYAFFDGISVDKFITSKFIAINMISGSFQVGELVESDPLFTSGKFSFRLCTPNHIDGPYNNPTKVFTSNIVSFPLAKDYDLNQSSYSESSRSLNVDLNSLASPSEVLFSGYARPSMKLIGRSSGAIAEVVESILVTDESGFLTASFFIPNPTIETNPKFINGTNTFTLTNNSALNNVNYLSFTEAKYFSKGTTNVTDNNNITTRNYTIIPAKTVNETITVNTTSNIITQTSPSNPGSTPTINTPSTSTPSFTSSKNTATYQGVASGYIPSTNSFGTVNQNVGSFAPSTGTNLKTSSIGAAGVKRALGDGYTIAEVQAWVTSSGATVGVEAFKQFGLQGVRNGY
jgi:hypothetical protein